jgi:hypothetical protein
MSPAERKENPGENELNIFRHVIKANLWFFVFFVMKNPLANHPFIVQACKEIQNCPPPSPHMAAKGSGLKNAGPDHQESAGPGQMPDRKVPLWRQIPCCPDCQDIGTCICKFITCRCKTKP